MIEATKEQLDDLEALYAKSTPGDWELWTSNSWRRITAKGGADGGVLWPSCGDNRFTCTLSGPQVEENLALMIALHNAFPSLLAAARMGIDAGEPVEPSNRAIMSALELSGVRKKCDVLKWRTLYESCTTQEYSHKETVDVPAAWLTRFLRAIATHKE